MALGMLFEYYGLYLNREQLRQEAGVSETGTTSRRLAEAFSRNGFDTRLRRPAKACAGTLALPAVARWKGEQFCVVTRLTPRKIYLNDPDAGRLSMPCAEFDKLFEGEWIEALPGPGFHPSGKKNNLRAHIRAWFLEDKKVLFYILVLGGILILLSVILPASYKIFLDGVLGMKQHHFFRPLIILLVVLMVLNAMITFTQQWLIKRLEIKLAVTHTARFFRHLLRLPILFFMSRRPGELSKRIPLNATLALIFASDWPKTITNFISILVYAFVMLNYNVVLTVIGVFFSVVNLVALKYITLKREALNQTIVQNQGKTYNISTIGLEMIETIKSTASENDFFAHWANYQIKNINNEQGLGLINKFLTVLPNFLRNLNNIILICLGSLLVIYGNMTIGILVAFQALMDTFTKPMSDIINNGGKLQDAAASLTTLQDLNETSEDEVFTLSKPLDLSRIGPGNAKLQGRLEIRHLQFGYNKYEKPLLDDFNLDVEPGKSVALVGSSGSGKSTVAKLIAGLFEPWQGEILFDGHRRTDYPRLLLANSLSTVDQHIFLFSGTVTDNITMWNRTIPHDTVATAARDACILDVVNAREGGLECKVEEGGKNFSGGQQQRLEIARALVNDPVFLILDEATSALDPNTEKIIMNNLRRRVCTTLVIAHRLSTIRDCDEIVVLDRGKIVQRGTHEELIGQLDGLYYNLIKLN